MLAWGAQSSSSEVTANLAFGKEQLDPLACFGMRNGVVLALFVVAQGVEAA